MNAERLLQHFDRISEAPDAIPRLRRFILDLAVRGKLVEQDPNDEPALELLKRIEIKKAKLVKKVKGLPEVTDDEKPFDAPQGWEWVRIRQVTIDRGQTVPQTDFTYFDVTAIDKERGCISEPKILSASEAPSRARKLVQKGDVIYSCVRPYLLNVAVLNTEIKPTPIASTAFAVLYGFDLVLPKYLWITLRSPFMVEGVETCMRGQAYPAINDSDFALLPIPLPPLAEQHRIVAKVDELMALCDQLEAAKTEREQSRDRLGSASLHRLNSPGDTAGTDVPDLPAEQANAFRDHARFVFKHLPRLITRPEHIKQLRQTILNLAVCGKLVPQDSNDEPASELLKRIQAEKAQLVKKGELKKDKAIWEGLPNEAQYSLPPGWSWARLQDVFEISRGGSPRPAGDPRYFGGSIPWITVREITKDDGKYLLHTEGSLTEEGAARSRFINPGDLLLTNSGATLGVPKISKIRACMNDGVAVLRVFHLDNVNDFAFLYLLSQTQSFRQINQGMGQPNLNTLIIAGWFFPLPPLAEQHRIVAKVDELMALCDQLEAQLNTTEADSRRLLEAVLHEALHPPLAATEHMTLEANE